VEISSVDHVTALIVSDDSELSRAIVSQWQAEPSAPVFTLIRSDVCKDLNPDSYDLAIVAGVRDDLLSPVLEVLAASERPVLLVGEDGDSNRVLSRHPSIKVLPREANWLNTVVLVSTETLQYSQAMKRLRQAEYANRLLEGQAALGRYLLEIRNALNNSLTSVLGNSELLLSPPENLSPAASLQIETIRNMAVRMHEMLQRFTSLEKELKLIEKQEVTEAGTKAQQVSASS
jgi:signal transduction histidine kinase